MKLTQQVHQYTRKNKNADVKSGACIQEKLENNELCRKFRC